MVSKPALEYGYSPLYLHNLYKKMIDQEWSVEEAFSSAAKNHKLVREIEWVKQTYYYRQIIEAHYVSIMCLAIYKHYGIKHDIILSDAPDVIMINKENSIPVEVYEMSNYNSPIKSVINIKEEISKLTNKKLQKDYGQTTRLLIVTRISSSEGWFNLSEYIKQLSEYDWKYPNIWLMTFSKENDNYTFFDIFPVSDEIVEIDFSITRDLGFLY